jgi:hypothetical protein
MKLHVCPASTEEYIVDQEPDSQRGERHEQVKRCAFDASLRPSAGRRAVTTPVVGNRESVPA